MDAAEDSRDLVFVDLETTGASPAYDRVIEVAIIRLSHDGRLLDEYSALVNPEREIPANIESFTGIGNPMVQAAPRFSELAPVILGKLDGARFVAHNARFDYSFLRREFARLAHDFSAEVLCTVRLSRRLHPEFERHNLDALIDRHGVRCQSRHRAMGDAQVIATLWAQWRTSHPERFIDAMAHAHLKPPKLPAHLPAELTDVLPDVPGVYRFFGEGDQLLYVGKGVSLRAKVLQQLGDEHPGSRDHRLASETRRVEWQETAGELGAMLREAAVVHDLKPLYNRRAKGHDGAVTLGMQDSGVVEILRLDGLEAGDVSDTFGIFHTTNDARKALKDIAAAKNLCLKVLGLESGEGSCMALQLGRCKGACVGREPRILHDMRAKMALSPLKIKRWPFPGRIALKERAAHAEEVHVLDQWSYLGSASTDEELESLSTHQAPSAFDVGVYKILLRYFTNHSKIDWRELRP